MRARWALLQAGLLVQWREIELKAKPAAMLEVSAKGTVPVLVLPDGSVIDESLAIMRWALQQADPRGVLEGEGSDFLIEENDGPFKHHLDRFKYTDRYPGALKENHRQAGLEILRRWSERIRRNGWLLADRLALADAALWPFVRQWRLADAAGFDADHHLAPLREWLMRFLDDPMMERLMQRADPWLPGAMQPIFPADAIAIPIDQPLFHLALEADWKAALQHGDYRVSTRGLFLEQVGFIHLSWQEQVQATFDRFYADAGAVLSLRIDPKLVSAPLRADAIHTGVLFPHLYGPLPIASVVEVSPFSSLPPC
jgi:glutathione S-transferase